MRTIKAQPITLDTSALAKALGKRWVKEGNINQETFDHVQKETTNHTIIIGRTTLSADAVCQKGGGCYE